MLSDITSREVDAVREFSDFLITQDGATLGGGHSGSEGLLRQSLSVNHICIGLIQTIVSDQVPELLPIR